MDRRLAEALIFLGLGFTIIGLLVVMSAKEFYMHIEWGVGMVVLGICISIIGWRTRKRAILVR